MTHKFKIILIVEGVMGIVSLVITMISLPTKNVGFVSFATVLLGITILPMIPIGFAYAV